MSPCVNMPIGILNNIEDSCPFLSKQSIPLSISEAKIRIISLPTLSSWEVMSSIFWLILLSQSSLITTQPLLSPNNGLFQGKSIFILAGQSNMSGRGGVTNGTWDGFVPPECRSNPRVRQLSAELKWEEAKEPLHRDIDVNKTCGVGPAMAFANSVLEREAGMREIGLVPCAIGGTNISEWGRGSELYDRMVVRARAALRDGGGVFRAILWYQGESDTVSHEDAKLYKRRLEKFFTDVRSDLNSPLLPIIQVALASGEGQYVEKIRKAQLETDLPNVRCVDAKGLPLQLDELHLTTSAQVRLGKMLSNAFLQTMGPLSVHSSSPNRFNNFLFNFLTWFK